MNDNLFMQNFVPGVTYWTTYDNLVNSLSPEQRNFVARQKSVIDAKRKLIDCFIDYLFEQNKESFVACSNTAYKTIADDYIKAIKDSAGNYVSHSENLEKENSEMKQKLEELMKKLEMAERRNGTEQTSAN